MATINPYLNFSGTTEEAFLFYRSVFGGEFSALQRFKDFQDGEKLSTSDAEKIMHIALPIGRGNVLMGTDSLECMGQSLTIGNNFTISIDTDSEAEADKLFHALSSGGNIKMPMEKVFWGDYFGMLTDKFGIQWMVSYNYQAAGAANQVAVAGHSL